MKKRAVYLILLLGILLVLAGCAPAATGLEGTYNAVNPPVESGEMVILSLTFTADKVTMASGDVQQTVPYTVKDNTFSIVTDYGTFSYAFEAREDGSIVIDGVEYQKQ